MNGKSKCKILKDIRKKIAEDNDITYVTSECKYQGDCSGTCPKCEAELRYLEEELAKRKNVGKTVAVAGIAAALVVSASGCTLDFPMQTAGMATTQPNTGYQTEPSETIPIAGGLSLLEETQPTEELLGEPAYPDDVLMGVPTLKDPACPD